MSRKKDRDYYARRRDEEGERGEESVSPAVAAIHYELAYRYAILAAQPAAGTPKLTLVNNVSPEDGIALEKAEIPRNKDPQVVEIVGERNDRPVFDRWGEKTKIGSAP